MTTQANTGPASGDLSAPEAALARYHALLHATGIDPVARGIGGYAVITGVRRRQPFRLGEILVLHSERERETEGDERNPSQWDLKYEWFGTDFVAALARSREVSAFRHDPEWRVAHARLIADDYGGKTPDEMVVDRLQAAADMRRIEERYKP